MAFRHFVAPGEFENLGSVLAAARHAAVEDGLRDELSSLGRQWNHTLERGFVRMSNGDISLTPRVCLDLWFNGDLFHSDPEKAQLLRQLREAAVPSVDIQFHWSLRVLTGLVLEAALLIASALDSNAFRFEVATD